MSHNRLHDSQDRAIGLSQRWRDLWPQIGATTPDVAPLIDAYAATDRHYHTLQHLDECFARLDSVREHARDADAIACALFFHDVIYDTHRADNEAKSADHAREVALAAGVDHARVERITGLVLATKHAEIPADADQRLICDIDLGILAAAESRFDEYEHQIRAEYSWVPAPLFRARRAAVLEGLLSRPSVFATDHFRARDEAAARANLARSLTALRGPRSTS